MRRYPAEVAPESILGETERTLAQQLLKRIEPELDVVHRNEDAAGMVLVISFDHFAEEDLTATLAGEVTSSVINAIEVNGVRQNGRITILFDTMEEHELFLCAAHDGREIVGEHEWYFNHELDRGLGNEIKCMVTRLRVTH